MVQNLILRQPARRNSTGNAVPSQTTTETPTESEPKSAQSPVQSTTNSVFMSASAAAPMSGVAVSTPPTATAPIANQAPPTTNQMNSSGGHPTFHMYAPPVLTTGTTAPTSKREEHVNATTELSRLALGFPTTPPESNDITVLHPALDAPRRLINAEPPKKMDSVI